MTVFITGIITGIVLGWNIPEPIFVKNIKERLLKRINRGDK